MRLATFVSATRLVACAVDVEARLFCAVPAPSILPSAGPDARRAAPRACAAGTASFEAATGERATMFSRRARPVFSNGFSGAATGDDRRAWSPVRPAARPRCRAGVDIPAAAARCAPPTPGRNRRAGRWPWLGSRTARHRDFGHRLRRNRSGSDTSTRACFAGRGRDRPFGIAAQPVERQARLVEFAGHRDADRVEMRGAAPSARVDAARQVLSTPGQPARGRAVSIPGGGSCAAKLMP